MTSLGVWLTFQISGRAVIDVVTASRSLVFDLATRAWSSETAHIFGLDAVGGDDATVRQR